MKISIDIFRLHQRFGDEKTVKMIKKAGFDCLDYTFSDLEPSENEEILGENYVAYAKGFRELLDKYELPCNQAHAPYEWMKYGYAFDVSEERYAQIVRAMEAASIMGAPHIIVHPLAVPAGMDVVEINVEYFKTLEPYCEKFGIRIAIENLLYYDPKRECHIGILHTPTELYRLLEKLNSPWFYLCVDVGHAALTGHEPEDFIRALDNRVLKALHIHDNNYLRDHHQLPFTGKFNWLKIAEALKEIGYQGDFTLETSMYIYNSPDDFVEYALEVAARTARYLASKIED